MRGQVAFPPHQHLQFSFFFFHFSHFHWICQTGSTLHFLMVLKSFPLFLISLIFQMTSPQTLSWSCPSVWCPGSLGAPPAFSSLFRFVYAETCYSVSLESCHSLCHHLLTNAQGGPSEILGAYQCSDLQPTQIWWVFGIRLTSFPVCLICKVWLPILLPPPPSCWGL